MLQNLGWLRRVLQISAFVDSMSMGSFNPTTQLMMASTSGWRKNRPAGVTGTSSSPSIPSAFLLSLFSYTTIFYFPWKVWRLSHKVSATCPAAAWHNWFPIKSEWGPHWGYDPRWAGLWRRSQWGGPTLSLSLFHVVIHKWVQSRAHLAWLAKGLD